MRNNGQCISYSEFFFSNSAAVISQQHGVKFKKIFRLFHDGGRYERVKDFPGIYQLK